MKRIMTTAFILVILTFAVAIYFYNKPHDTIEEHDTEQVDATSLTQEFTTDEAAATEKYLNKALSVVGTPYEVTKNDDGYPVVLFSQDGLTGVQCTLRDKDIEVPTDKAVTIEGFCNGYTVVVLLSNCILKK